MIKQLLQGLPKEKTLIYFLLVIAAATLVYSNHFNNAFHFDDSHAVENNLFIRDIKNIPLFFKDATTFSSLPSNQSYRPIVSASLAIDYWLGKGYNMFYFHLSSFIIFILQGVIMFFFIFRIFNISYKNNWNFYFAAVAVAWYLLHPANAETINYVIARSDLQSTFFIVLGFIFYVFSPFCKKNHLYLIPVLIGGLAKPTAVMFAPLLFFYVLLFEENMSLYQIFKKQYFSQLWIVIKKTIPSFIFCVVMYKFIDHFTPATWESGGRSVYSYLITQPFVIVHYFTTFFFPFGLSADTDWEPLQKMGDIRFFIGCAFILLMIAIAFLFSKDKRLRPVSYGILWFFLALVPSSSVIPFAEVLNDHRIFFPYVGLVISVCWTAGLLVMKYKKYFTKLSVRYEVVVAIAVMVILSGYSYGTYQRNKVWNTEESLWYDVTLKSPKNARGLMNYGLSRMAKGDYKEAERCFTKALTMWPYYSALHINMGVLKNATGDKEGAETYFKNATQYGGHQPDTWYFYGNFLSSQKRYTEAVPMLEKCVELAPASIGGRSALMRAYNDTGEWDKLNTLAQSTLQIMPDNEEARQYLEASKNKKGKIEMMAEDARKAPTAQKYFDLCLMYYQAGKYQECVNAGLEAVKLKPDYADAYNNLCSAYTLLKEYDKAIEACNKAIAIKPDYQLAKNNLADAIDKRDKVTKLEETVSAKPTPESYLDLSLNYYQQGLFEKSVEACIKAIELRPNYVAAYSNMGAAYNKLQQWDKAIEACSKALEIDPGYKLAKGNLNWAKDEKAKLKK
jgi:tetratricopeptide (TPR) repeat protein